MKIIVCPLLTLVFASNQILEHTQSFLSLSTNNHLVWWVMQYSFLSHESQWDFWPVSAIASSFTPTRKLHLSAHWLESAEFRKFKGIKATQGTGTWSLDPINAFSNLNFSHPFLVFKRFVLSNSSTWSMATDVVEHSSIKRENTKKI